jgi:hypothetical protein
LLFFLEKFKSRKLDRNPGVFQVYLRDFALFCFGNRVSDISRKALIRDRMKFLLLFEEASSWNCWILLEREAQMTLD